MKDYRVIGLMSGTSLDGLDIAYCRFKKGRIWKARIVAATTIKYSPAFRKWISGLYGAGNASLRAADEVYGTYLAEQVSRFCRRHKIRPDLIASHGHTIRHRPEKGITLQIGNGRLIADKTGIMVVCDFRSGDVKLGGQGAPLVPVADRLLFGEYDLCLNLGGFANISFEKNRKRIAFDICPVNIVLNELAAKFGKEYDRNGSLARRGRINSGLLDKLNGLNYYSMPSPKSLGREWLERSFLKVLNAARCSKIDKLRTVVEHIAIQIANAEMEFGGQHAKWLVTGGGAKNKFLISRIRAHISGSVIVPEKNLLEYKEALAFALLGVLRIRQETNVYKTVTGASRDSSGGRIFKPGV